MKKTKSAPLLLALLLLLTACGGGNGAGNEPQEEEPSTAYLPEYTELDIDGDIIAGCAGSGDYAGDLFVVTSGPTGEALYRVSGGEVQKLSSQFKAPDGQTLFGIPQSIQTGAEGTVWLRLSGSTTENRETRTFLLQVDGEGRAVELIEPEGLSQSWAGALEDDALVDAEGWLFLFTADGTLHVLDENREPRFSLEAGRSASRRLTLLSDGRAGVLVNFSDDPDTDGFEVRAVDKETGDWSDVYPVGGYNRLYPGDGTRLFYCGARGVLAGWNGEAGKPEKILNWMDAGISSSSLKAFAGGDGGQLQAVDYTNKAWNLVALTPAAPGTVPQKKTVTLGCVAITSQLLKMVNQFNQNSTTHRVVVKEYMEPGDTWDAGMEKLIVDLTAGNVPDLLRAFEIPVQQYGARGLLEDLWPYIENDPDLGREGVMEHVLECCEQEGKLYMLSEYFTISTYIGAKSVVGDRLGWTLRDLQEAFAAMPEGSRIYDPFWAKTEVLKGLIYEDLEHYVDYTNKKCFFESGEFKDLLAFVNGLDLTTNEFGAESTTSEYMLDGMQMLDFRDLADFFDIQTEQMRFRGPVSFVGSPRSGGKCGSSFNMSNHGLVMTSGCADKEAAWTFMRELLLPRELEVEEPDDLNNYGFPVGRANFERLAEECMKERGEDWWWWQSYTSTEEGDRIFLGTYHAVTQREYDQLMELYNAVETAYSLDETVWQIVKEQALAYFAGDRPLDETVRLIQDRVTLYINE